MSVKPSRMGYWMIATVQLPMGALNAAMAVNARREGRMFGVAISSAGVAFIVGCVVYTFIRQRKHEREMALLGKFFRG